MEIVVIVAVVVMTVIVVRRPKFLLWGSTGRQGLVRLESKLLRRLVL